MGIKNGALLVTREIRGDVDGVTALYEPRALLDAGGGRPMHGREAIGKFSGEPVAMGRKFEMGEQRPQWPAETWRSHQRASQWYRDRPNCSVSELSVSTYVTRPKPRPAQSGVSQCR